MKKISTLLAALVLLKTTAQAQYRTNYKSVADRFYAKGDYNSAASYYQKYLSGASPVYKGYSPYQMQKQGTHLNNINKQPLEVVYKLADSYYRLNYFSQAEPLFKMLMEKHMEQYPQSMVLYAVCLRAKGDHVGALAQLEKCMLTYRVYDKYAELVHNELDTCLLLRRQGQKATNLQARSQ
jgi:OOP family OmpA-OmpF porin